MRTFKNNFEEFYYRPTLLYQLSSPSPSPNPLSQQAPDPDPKVQTKSDKPQNPIFWTGADTIITWATTI